MVPGNLELPRTDVTLDEFQRAGLEKRPMNAAYQALVKRYRYQKKLADLDDYPDVTLWGSWRFRDDNLPDDGTDFVSAGVSFNLPVYREKRRAAVAEADAALRMAEYQTDGVSQLAYRNRFRKLMPACKRLFNSLNSTVKGLSLRPVKASSRPSGPIRSARSRLSAFWTPC